MKRMMWLAAVAIAAPCVFAETIAYWPMNVTESGGKRYVNDVSGNGYNFSVRAESSGGATFVDNDIGWLLPPNPDPTVEDAESFQMLQSDNENLASGFNPVLQQSTTIRDRLSYENDFTLEGWFRAKALPDPSGSTVNKFIFVFNSVGQDGGWMWYLTAVAGATPGEVSEYRFYIEYCHDGGTRSSAVLMTILPTDVDWMKSWNHYALVCANKDDSKRRFSLYVNGRQMGYADVVTPTPGKKGGSLNLSSAGSSSNKQAMIGDLTCWRASDVALKPDQLLCGAPRTVAYWTMTADGQSVKSPISTFATLMTRNPTLGGISSSPNDIGWTIPPNPDPEMDADDPAWKSTMMLTVEKDTNPSINKDGNPSYTAALSASGENGVYLAEGLCPTHSFTIEGWFRPSELPAGSSANHMLAYNTLTQYGGWIWNLYGPDATGQCAIKVGVVENKDNLKDRTTYNFTSVGQNEILGKWCHYALSYDVTTRKWSFYLNGMHRGTSAAGPDLSDVAYSGPFIYLFGCGSSTAQIPTGDVSTWRISRGVLAVDELLCGAGAFVWSGTENAVWSTGSQANWKINGTGDDVAWVDGVPATIDESSTTTEITLGSAVSPKTLVADIDRDVKIVAGSGTKLTGCEEIVKTGEGTLWFYSLAAGINDSANTVHIKEGTLRVTNPNKKSGLGKGASETGYSVYVYDGGTLWPDQRNSLGDAGPSDVNNIRVTVYTNGVFDLTWADMDGNNFNIQTVSTLDLLGGTLILPTTGHSSGCLQVRDRITFGKNPTKTPYVFNTDGRTTDTLTWQLGVNTEYRVEDITEDAAPDVTFNNHLMAKTLWETNEVKKSQCGIRKTGAGTMVIAQARDGWSKGELCYPTGGVTVEEGELRVDGYFETPFSVASGAFLSGTGTIASDVTFAAGAGIRGVIGQAAPLTVTGNCMLGATGTVEIRNPTASTRRRVHLLHVDGTLTGGENLANWTLTVDGKPTDEAVLAVRGNDIVVKGTAGALLIVR